MLLLLLVIYQIQERSLTNSLTHSPMENFPKRILFETSLAACFLATFWSFNTSFRRKHFAKSPLIVKLFWRKFRRGKWRNSLTGIFWTKSHDFPLGWALKDLTPSTSKGIMLYKIIATKGSIYIRQIFNSHIIGFGHENDPRSTVLDTNMAHFTSSGNA